MNKTALILIGLVVVSNIAAEARAPRNERRERHQESRIEKGVSNGSLTNAEQRRLQKGQQRVDQAQAAAAADGTVSAREKAKIEKMQDVQSKRIFRQKHDGQSAPEEQH